VSVFSWPTERPHNATVVRVVDGDTVVCDVDLDYHITLSGYKVRLRGCAAAPVNTPGGNAAAKNLDSLLPPRTPLVLVSVSSYKYGGGKDHIGEFVATPWLGDVDLVAQLIADGWAAPWNGTGRQPVPPWPRVPVPPAQA